MSFRNIIRLALLVILTTVLVWGPPPVVYCAALTSPLLFLTGLLTGSLFAGERGAGEIFFVGPILLGGGVFLTVLFRKRFFCRRICPLGTLQEGTSWLAERIGRGIGRFFPGRRLPKLPPAPFSVLGKILAISAILLAIFGGRGLLNFDPLSIFGAVWAAESVRARSAVITLGIILILSAFFPRFWCFALCPCGAISDLAFEFRRFLYRCRGHFPLPPPITFENRGAFESGQRENSNGINKNPPARKASRNQAISPTQTISPPTHSSSRLSPFPLSPATPCRRLFLGEVGRGVLAVFGGGFLFLWRTASDRFYALGADLFAFRPPGAVPEPIFDARCARCGRCSARCPRGVLVPGIRSDEKKETLTGRIGGLGPFLDFSRGSCDENCRVCGETCPTGAIRPLSPAERRIQKRVIPYLDLGECRLWNDRECSVCRRECSGEAISFVWNDEEYLNIPVIDLKKCSGCGRCAEFCPGMEAGKKAIRMVPEKSTKESDLVAGLREENFIK